MNNILKYRLYIFFFICIILYFFIHGYMEGRFSDLYGFIKKYKKIEIGMKYEDIQRIYPSNKYIWKFRQDKEDQNILILFPKSFEEINDYILHELGNPIDSAKNLCKLHKSIIFILDENDKVYEYGWSDPMSTSGENYFCNKQ